MRRKLVIFVADSLDNAHKFQQVLAHLDVEVAAGSSAHLERLLVQHPSYDLIVYEARGDVQPLKALFPGLVRHGQQAADGPQLPREGKLPQEDGVLRVARKLPGGFEQRDQQGQVVDGALFLLVGRGQVHGDAADGKVKAAVLQGRAHPVPGFLHRRVRQAHQLEGGQPLGEVRFHFYRKCLHAIKAHAVYFRHHPHTPSFLGNAGFIIRQLCREYNALLKNAAQFCGRKEELDETVLHGI